MNLSAPSRRKKAGDAIILLAMAAVLVAGCLTFGDYGFTVDEGLERRSGIVNYQYILQTLFGHELRVYDLDLSSYNDRYYGVFMQLPMVVCEHLAHFSMPLRDVYLMRHLYTFLLCFLGYVCFFFFCKKVFNSKWMGLLGVGMLALYPRFWGEQFTNIKDMVFMATMCAAMLAALCCLEHENRARYGIIAALAGAVCANTRIIGAIVPLMLFGYRVVRDLFITRVARERGIPGLLGNLGKYAAQLLLFYAFFVLSMPILWHDPIRETANVFFRFSDYNVWNGTQVFGGKLYQGEKVPWYFIPVWLGISLPIWYLALLALSFAAVVAGILRARRAPGFPGVSVALLTEYRYFLFGFFIAFLPWLATVVMRSTLYNGWRHFYFALPAMVTMMLYAVAFAWRRWFRDRRRLAARGALAGALCVLLAGQAIWIAAHHPFEKVFFNAAGVRVADGFERDYWWESGYAQLKYLLENDPSERIFLKGEPTTAVQFLYPLDAQRLVFGTEGDYVLEFYNHVASSRDVAHEGYIPWHTVSVDGHPLSTLYIRDGRLAKGPE